MIARRVATAVIAVGLIVGAFLVRRNVIEGDDDADAGDGSAPAAQLVCLTELADVCSAIAEVDEELAITVEDAGMTLDRLREDGSVPLWLTFQPFPAMTGTLAAGDVLAANRLAVATPADRAATLATRCADRALWRCIGDVAGEEWGDVPGRVEPSVGDATTSAVALASFASAVAGYFATTDLTSALWTGDAEFLAWVRGLVREVPLSDLTGGTPLATMLTRPSAVNVAATSDAELAALGARRADVEPSYPEPSMWLQAVLAAPAGTDIPPDVTSAATTALGRAGWVAPDAAQTPLPSATTMVALRQLWEELQ